jgi:hypothetical protein
MVVAATFTVEARGQLELLLTRFHRLGVGYFDGLAGLQVAGICQGIGAEQGASAQGDAEWLTGAGMCE